MTQFSEHLLLMMKLGLWVLNQILEFWVKVENNSFIALPGKGGHSALIPLKTVSPSLEGFCEEFYSDGSREGLLVRNRVC